jgi:hypothetical protein
LNESFKPHGFAFKLIGTTHSRNASWTNINGDSEHDFEMKDKLQQGTYKDLNLYFAFLPELGSNRDQLLGFAYV